MKCGEQKVAKGDGGEVAVAVDNCVRGLANCVQGKEQSHERFAERAERLLGMCAQLLVGGRVLVADLHRSPHLLVIVPVQAVQAEDERGEADREYHRKFENILETNKDAR